MLNAIKDGLLNGAKSSRRPLRGLRMACHFGFMRRSLGLTIKRLRGDSDRSQTIDALSVAVEGVEALMSHGESCGKIHPASDDLDVARRFARSGSGQCGVELAERGDP